MNKKRNKRHHGHDCDPLSMVFGVMKISKPEETLARNNYFYFFLCFVSAHEARSCRQTSGNCFCLLVRVSGVQWELKICCNGKLITSNLEGTREKSKTINCSTSEGKLTDNNGTYLFTRGNERLEGGGKVDRDCDWIRIEKLWWLRSFLKVVCWSNLG